MLYIFAVLCLTLQVHSYILLQVRKDDQNRSNVDALIHKVVPSEEFDKFANKIARKQFSNRSKPQQEKEGKMRQNAISDRRSDFDGSADSEETRVEESVIETVKNIVKQKPVLRTMNFKISNSPEGSGSRNKPALAYELDAATLIRAVREFLSSPVVAQYAEDAAKKAAIVYRTVKASLQ